MVAPPPYRAAAPRPPDPYATAWRVLRGRRLAMRIAAGVLGYAVATSLALTLGSHDKKLDVVNAVLVCIVFAAFIALRRKPFLCPRCAGHFFWGAPAEIGFEKHCHQCGLAVDSPYDESGATPAESSPAGTQPAARRRAIRWGVFVACGAAIAGVTSAVLGTTSAKLNFQLSTVNAACNSIRSATILYYSNSLHRGACPSVARLKADHYLPPYFRETDPWETPFTVQCTPDEISCGSAGPDRTWSTDDDILIPPPEGK